MECGDSSPLSAAGPERSKRVRARATHIPLILAFCLLAVSGAGARAVAPVAGPAAGAPNVLFITIDTLRADRLGCYGYAGVKTPVLDALAREGVRFEAAFSPVPLTLPAHASMFTGLYPATHGIRDNSGFVLPEEHTTLAEVLKRSGYRTAGFVGAFVLDSKFGLAQGFDFYHDDFDLSRYENVSPGYIQRTGDEVVRRAIEWLESRNNDRRSPFFVWTHLYDPHDPYTPPEPYLSRHRQSPYDGEVEFTDANVGVLLEWLRRNGLYDDTLVVVTGDHGESLGEHGEKTHGFFLYNATLHVPLILKMPKGQHGGRTVADSVSLVDLFPTVLQILNVGRSEASKVQGKGLLSLALGKGGSYRPEIYAECYYPRLQFGWSEIRALITDRYKYILAPRPELYDYRNDFSEARDLAGERSVLANQLRDALKGLMQRYGRPVASPSAASRPLDPETREKLSSLGYVSLSLGDTGTEDSRNLRDPKDEIGTYNEITSLFEKSSRGEYRAVIPRYERILKEQPGLKLVRYKLAQAYFQAGNYEAALDSYRKAIEAGGDAALATYDLAQTYMKMGRIEDAILGFRRAIELDPTHYRARTNLGILLKGQGKLEDAIRQLEAAIAHAPSSVIALSNLAVSYSMSNRHSDAESTMRRAVALSPEDGLLRANLAAVLHRMGREEEARREMEEARRLNPSLRRP